MKKIVALFLICLVVFSFNSKVHAKRLEQDNLSLVEAEESSEDTFLSNAVLVSTDTYVKDGREITCNTYVKSDGTKVIDTLSVDIVSTYSLSGTKTATRTREITGWGTVTLTASFAWYTEVPFSYVKCTYADYLFSLDSKAALSKVQLSYTKDYVSVGKANAQVSYYMYNKTFPAQFVDDTFRITCTDTGTISTN